MVFIRKYTLLIPYVYIVSTVTSTSMVNGRFGLRTIWTADDLDCGRFELGQFISTIRTRVLHRIIKMFAH